MRQWALVGILALLGVVDVSAQTPIPGRVFVKDSNGDVWYVGAAGSRAPVALYPASDDDLSAIPVLDGWFAARPDGAGVGFAVGPRPDYSAGQQAAPLPIPAPEDPVKLEGDRARNTRPFDLRGGTYVATWKATLPGRSPSCSGSAHLYRVDGPRLVERLYSVSLTRPGDPSANGETMLYNVAAGSHYLDASGGCEWTVEIKPG